MIEKLTAFIDRHDFFILTTHDPADADGLGSQMVMACVLREKGKRFRIINGSAIPKQFRFMDPQGMVEQWDKEKHRHLPAQAGLILLDTSDEHHTGKMREPVGEAKEVFVIDHHERKPNVRFSGIAEASAASTSELAVELAHAMGTVLDSGSAFAAYIGIAYDTGFFAYPTTGARTLRSALTLLTLGVNPNDVYQQLHENASVGALLLQKKALSGLTLYCNNRVAVQTLRLADFAEAGALPEESEGFVNFPLKAKEIIVSLLLKESQDGKIRCSLRSKGNVNVAKIAMELSGGGHGNAAGFKSELGIEQVLEKVMDKIAKHLGEL
jgi:phosphoesterase RecJ-like protein